MKISFTSLFPDFIDADLFVMGVHEEERPFRGAAGLIDWRMRGLISRQVQNGTFRCQKNEKLLIPAQGSLSARWILVQGLGSGLHFDSSLIRDFSTHAIKTALGLKCEKTALFFPHLATEAHIRQHALKHLLEGAGAVAAQHSKSEFISSLNLIVPSTKEETVDLKDVIVTKLLTRHQVPVNLYR